MLNSLFYSLASVHQLHFQSRSQAGSQMNWNINGSGSVAVRVNEKIIDFDETILLDNGRHCHDQKRWQFTDHSLIFSRHRNGQYEQLFEFTNQNNTLTPTQPYFCTPDRYSATITLGQSDLILTIYINSARKNECLRYHYPFSQPSTIG